MQSLHQSPRSHAALPQGQTLGPATATAATGTTGIAGPEEEFAALLTDIDDLNAEGGPDVFERGIDNLIAKIGSQPPSKTSTLVLRLLTSLQRCACSSNAFVSDIATDRFNAYMGLLKASMEDGAPNLTEVCLATRRRRSAEIQAGANDGHQLAPRLRHELKTLLRNLGQSLVEDRIAALRLPSTYQGTDFNVANDANPFCVECKELIDATTLLETDLDLVEETLEVLRESGSEIQALDTQGQDSLSKTYDMACLNKWLERLAPQMPA